MTKIAIDVAIIPPEPIMDLCIKINSDTKKRGFHADELRKTDFVPHITLFMGVVKLEDLPKIQLEIENVVKNSKTLDLQVTEYSESSHRPTENSYLKILKSEELLKLHTALVDVLSRYASAGATPDVLYDSKEIGQNTKKWLENFVQNSSYDKFKPHITLRCKKIETAVENISFVPGDVGLFHAGNHVTCRKLIKKYELKK